MFGVFCLSFVVCLKGSIGSKRSMSWNIVVPKLAFQKEFIWRLMKPFELIELFKPFELLNP